MPYHAVAAETVVVPTPAAAATPVAVAVAAVAEVAAVAPAPVIVEAAPYVLPTDSLAAIADGAGLQWVNSDAQKIRAVQEAMASAPAPTHLPRTPRARAQIDDGPLVLVETKKDLAQIKLPFESQPPQ